MANAVQIIERQISLPCRFSRSSISSWQAHANVKISVHQHPNPPIRLSTICGSPTAIAVKSDRILGGKYHQYRLLVGRSRSVNKHDPRHRRHQPEADFFKCRHHKNPFFSNMSSVSSIGVHATAPVKNTVFHSHRILRFTRKTAAVK